MRQRSAAFDAEFKRSHTVVFKADVYRRGLLVVEGLPVIGGSVQDDKTSEVRRRCTLTIRPDEALIPTQEWQEDSYLWPTGNEVQLYSGVRYASGAEEFMPVGRYRISKPSLVDSGEELTMSMDGFDRSRTAKRARFSEPYVIAKGRDYATAIQELILFLIPILTVSDFDFMVTDGSDGGPVYRTPLLTFTHENDPWVSAMDMAKSCGAELFFDGEGKCVMRKERDPSYEPPDWQYHEGEVYGPVRIERSLDDEGAYNGLVLDSNHSDLPAPLHAEHWDTNPASATYYDPEAPELSTYGRYPSFMNVQYVTTQQQADDAAKANFLRVAGIPERVGFMAAGHPAHESGDIVSLKRQRINVDSVYVMDALSATLGWQGEMNATTRQRIVTYVG
jgi:hypothetical protein